MKLIDTSQSTRIPLMMEMVSSLSRLMDPRDLLELCIGSMRRMNSFQAFLEVHTASLRPGQFRIARLLTHDGVDHVSTEDWLDPHPHPVNHGGAIGQIVNTSSPKAAHHLDLANDPVFGTKLAAYRSLVAVPIFRDGTPATWVILLDANPEHFQLEDLEELIVRANLVGAIVNNLQTTRQLFTANLRIQQEVDHIAQIQRALLPQETPHLPGLSIAASYETFEQAGGDLYDFVPLHQCGSACGSSDGDRSCNERWAILIGDVSGHGPSAAVVMAMFHAILHAFPQVPTGPAEMLIHVNRHLCDKPIGDCFVTAFLGFYEPATKRLVYARAGHHPPLLASPPDGKCTSLDAVGDLPLAIDRDVEYHETSVQLQAGQSLVLYTDGINEATNADGQWFGVEGIVRAIQSNFGDPAAIVQAITSDLHHQSHIRPRDDQTVVAIQVR